jgi:predicted amidohydrolase YtcJ
VDSDYEVGFLEGAGTEVIDCDGGVVLPGFIDAHTHLEMVGRRLIHADLSGAPDPETAVERLADRAAATDDEWVLGYGYDESGWPDGEYLTRDQLDRVSDTRPVVAFREDMHVASVNGVVLDRHGGEMPDGDVRTAGGRPTGVLVEGAVDVLFEYTAPDRAETRRLVTAARDRAHALGVTGVHEMVRNSHAPRVYRELDREGELALRVQLNYWTDHLDALAELGATTGHGSEMVRVGAVKSYTDGSFGGRTAKLTDPYTDADADTTGQWVVEPAELAEHVARADEAGLQFAAHAIGDAAVEATLDAYADATPRRNRVEHAELLTDAAIERFAELGVVASVQPNFLKWAREDGLYEARLGDRAARTNRYADLLAAGVPLAFGSDCMPLGPLFGVQQAVTAPAAAQRLTVTQALRAYTRGGAYAAGEEHELGTVASGKRADLVVLEASPWAVAGDAIADIDVVHTVVDGAVVYDRSNGDD